MTVLILGGIREAVMLASELHQSGVRVIYSIAGLVRQPDLECAVISGGFRQSGGLELFLRREEISMVVDVTHPYASKMSAQATVACQSVGIPCWRYLRSSWQPRSGDEWIEFNDWEDLHPALAGFKAVLFAIGRLPESFVNLLYKSSGDTGQQQWVRSAIEPEFALPPSMQWIEDIGPFELDGERRLFRQHGFDAIVCKNSGGSHTNAKIQIARESGLPVFIQRRPELSAVDRQFEALDDCCRAIQALSRVSVANAG